MKRDFRDRSVTLICETCRKPFHPWLQNRGTARFCSKACRRLTQEEVAPLRRKTVVRTCEACGQRFHPLYTSKAQRFCSLKCARKIASTARRMSKSEAAWLAGLFDGEGSIVWPKGEDSVCVRLTIANTNRELLETVKRRTGTGTLVRGMHTGAKYYRPGYKDGWAWQCYSENARKLLRQMLPWLIEKREKARRALR